MKLSRKILCLFTVMALSFLMAIMIMPMSKASASTEAPTVDSFVTVDAASIRVQEPYGIRFRTEMTAEDYGKIVAFAGGDATAVGFGTLIARGNDVDALKNVGLAVESTVWDTKENPTATETGKYAYNLVIKELSKDNLNDQYIALGYYEVNGTRYYANDYAVKTPLQVATKYAATFGAIDTNMPDQAYTLDIINKAMDGKTIAFKNANETVKYNEEFAPVILMDGVEITATEYRFDDESIAGMTANGAVKGYKGGETTITAVVKGFDGEKVTEITCTATINVTKNTATPLVKADGTLALNTNGQETTISIDGAPISATQTADTFNVVDYILDKAAPAARKEYTISVSSEGYEGSVKHTLIPVGNANFETEIGKSNANATVFLTEDVTLAPWVSATNRGTFYSGYLAQYYAMSAGTSLNGRGHVVNISIDNSEDNQHVAGIFDRLNANISNTVFKVTGKFNSAKGAVLLGTWIANGSYPNAGFVNCLFDFDVMHVNTTTKEPVDRAFALTDALATKLFKNNVIIVNSVGGKTLNPYIFNNFNNTPILEDNAIIVNNSDYNPSTGTHGNKKAINLYQYNTIANFLNGGEGKVYNGNADMVCKEIDITNGAVKVYSDWSDNWEFDSTNGTIKLCGKTVYDSVKETVTPAIDGNNINFNTVGQFTDVYATVKGGSEVKIATNALHTFDIGAYAIEQNWATLEGTEVTLRVESTDYAGILTHTFKKIDAQMAIDNSGILTFNTNNQPVTLKINDATVENVTSPYNLASYVYEQNITQTTTYKVVVESAVFTGEISYQFIPLTDSNFKSALIARISSADLSIGAHAYLTENITLEWKSGTDYGDFTHGYDSTKQVAVSIGNSNYELYANIDGRGYSISATIDNTNGAKQIGGVFTNIAGHLYNINFDFIVKGIGAKCHSLITNGVVQGGIIENCFINVKSESSGITSLIGTVARSSYFRNSVIRFESSVEDASLRVLSSGVTASSQSAPFAYVDNVILLDEGISTGTHIGDPAGSANISFGGIISNTFIYNKTTEKSALEVFLAGGACKLVKKSSGSNQMKAMTTTDDAGGSKVSAWDNVWAFDATAGTVKLCGTTVATVPAAE